MYIKWEEGAPAPVGNCRHTAVWLNELVYVGGGYDSGAKPDGGLKPLYTINCYDTVNDSWSNPIDVPYCFFAITTLNQRLLIAGGKDKSGKKTDQVLTMDANQLTNYTKMVSAKTWATAVGHEGMLLIAGGRDDQGKKLSSTELFDSNLKQWYICNDLLQPHSSLKSVIVDNILYLLGGINKDGIYSTKVFTAPLDTLPKHQLNWNAQQDTPWCVSAPVLNGTDLVLVGGYRCCDDTRTFNVYKFNKVSHRWEDIGCIPSARSFSAAVSTADNRIIVIGGQNDKGEVTNTVWIGRI